MVIDSIDTGSGVHPVIKIEIITMTKAIITGVFALIFFPCQILFDKLVKS